MSAPGVDGISAGRAPIMNKARACAAAVMRASAWAAAIFTLVELLGVVGVGFTFANPPSQCVEQQSRVEQIIQALYSLPFYCFKGAGQDVKHVAGNRLGLQCRSGVTVATMVMAGAGPLTWATGTFFGAVAWVATWRGSRRAPAWTRAAALLGNVLAVVGLLIGAASLGLTIHARMGQCVGQQPLLEAAISFANGLLQPAECAVPTVGRGLTLRCKESRDNIALSIDVITFAICLLRATFILWQEFTCRRRRRPEGSEV